MIKLEGIQFINIKNLSKTQAISMYVTNEIISISVIGM